MGYDWTIGFAIGVAGYTLTTGWAICYWAGYTIYLGAIWIFFFFFYFFIGGSIGLIGTTGTGGFILKLISCNLVLIVVGVQWAIHFVNIYKVAFLLFNQLHDHSLAKKIVC